MVQISFVLIKRVLLLISNIFYLIQHKYHISLFICLNQNILFVQNFHEYQRLLLFSVNQNYDSYFQKIFGSLHPAFIALTAWIQVRFGLCTAELTTVTGDF